MKRLLAALLLSTSASVAVAADPVQPIVDPVIAAVPPAFFLEGRLGAALGMVDDLRFINPIGVGFTTNPTVGDRIILNDRDLSSASSTGYIGGGLYIGDMFLARASYRYFGNFNFSGTAGFGGANFRQDLDTTAQGAFIGIGLHGDLAPRFFVEGVLDIGASFISSSGRQGANLGLTGTFPAANHVNLAYGGELTAGFKINDQVAWTVSGSWHNLGTADTGTTGAPPPAGMNPGERLEADLSVATIMTGIRLNM